MMRTGLFLLMAGHQDEPDSSDDEDEYFQDELIFSSNKFGA